MPSNNKGTFCPKNRYTSVYQGPTFGFVYLWLKDHAAMTVKYKAFMVGPFPYHEDNIRLSTSKTTLWFGFVAFYCDIQINPPSDVVIYAS